MNVILKILKAVSIYTLLLTLCGCRSGDGGENKYKIGVSQCSGGYWRERVNTELQMELLNHPGVTLDIRNAEDNTSRQKEDVRDFISRGYDLIILAPNESEPLAGVVEEAKRKGIPVVTFDRQVHSDAVTAHMEVDNYALGRGVVKYIRSMGHGNRHILEIRGPESASPAVLRHKGFIDAVKDEPGMTVVESVSGEWDRERAGILTDSIMRLHPEIDLVYAHTDHMALGASDALERLGRNDVRIIGIDGFPEQGITAVSEGKMTATLLYPTEGQRLLRLAMAVLKGEPYERVTRVEPLSPVDSSNADILLAQDRLLTDETAKIALLNDRIDLQLSRYTTQKILLWLVVVVVVLLSGFIFVLLRSINSNRSHQRELEEKNGQLKEEKEKQVSLYEQLSEATRSKLMFFTNVSHDLRTPLTLIAGPVEQVADDPCLTPHCRSLMQLTKKNVVILRRLIDQILDFRKLENGKEEQRLSEVDFAALLKEWAEAFSYMARKRDIRLLIEGVSEKMPTIAVDVEKMERVFFNLMSNAFKHTPDNGRISVSYTQTDDTVSYSVSDTGSGIDPEEAEKIFDRFYQVKGNHQKGSGIGLALTKAFIELHGGSITVAGEKGKGSEFTVTFPVRHTSDNHMVEAHITRADVELELSPVETDDDSYSEDKPTLLIIDDVRDIRTLISSQMGEEYNVLTASDGIQGLKMAAKYVPDIILCDVMMPGMNGFECLRRIKEEVSTSHIPVLMLTACSLDEQRVEGYEQGADAYLSKPFNLDVLMARCRSLIVNRRRIRELYGRGVSGSSIGREEGKRVNPMTKRGVQEAHRPNDVESDFYTRFVEIVKENMGDADLQVAAIASQMGLGQSQFTRKIKALTNYTPVELIRRIRLQTAKTLLLSSEKTVSEIAFAVGFTSLAYFSKCYKEEFGCPPSEAREGR